MLYAVKRFGILVLVIIGLGACSSTRHKASSIGERDTFRFENSVTTKEESGRLIKMLNWVKRNHYALALHEIESR
jgi:hypothetical protein